MSLQEIAVIWPAYWAYKNREARHQQQEMEREQEKAKIRGGRR